MQSGEQERRFFARTVLSSAAAWLEKREKDLAKPGALGDVRVGDHKRRDVTFGDAIDNYVDDSAKAIGRTKSQVLRSIRSFDIAGKPCAEIDSADIGACAQEKLKSGVTPQTVSNYMSHMSAVFTVAGPAWNYPRNEKAMRDALIVAKKLGLTQKSRHRDRRPTLDELDRLMTHFLDRSIRRPSSVPMHRVTAFAIFSTRRQEETTSIKCADLDQDGKRVLVRDVKNPGEKIGNDVWCDIPDPALAIIEAMPRNSDRIVPYSTDAISASFTRANQFLGIEDLRALAYLGTPVRADRHEELRSGRATLRHFEGVARGVAARDFSDHRTELANNFQRTFLPLADAAVAHLS